MGKEALEIGANTMQFFSRNPRGGNARTLDVADIQKLIALADEHQFGKLLVHAPYTLNPCSAKPAVVDFCYRAMTEDLERLEHLPGHYYNFHPGSHVGQGMDVGIEMIVDMLNRVLKKDQQTTVLLETIAGKGSEVGSRFEEIARIIEGVTLSEHLGVCIDTCHLHEAGYPITDDLDGVLEEFDRMIGVDRIKAVHLNDSKNPRGAHKDHHEKIGEGEIGIEAITRIINHPALRDLPFYLETPNELDGYAAEIALLHSLRTS